MTRLASILFLILGLAARGATLHTIITNTSWDYETNMSLVISGDGWTSQAAFLRFATNAANIWTNQTVWAGHPERWNVFAVHTNSTDDGTDVGGVTKTTPMDGSIVGTFPDVNSGKWSTIMSDALTGTGIYGGNSRYWMLVVLNDGTYCGEGHGASRCVISTNTDWDIMRHEMTGHFFGGVVDEYSNAGNATAAANASVPNLASTPAAGTNKWSFAVAALGTPTFVSSGAYKPSSAQCLMEALGNPLCLVCSNTISTNFLTIGQIVISGGGGGPSGVQGLNFNTLTIRNQ